MYFVDIELSKLRNTEFITRTVDGLEEEGLWIPIKKNGLVFGRHRTVHLKCLMKDRQPNPYGISHYISLYVKDPKIRQTFIDDGFGKALMFIGNAKPSFKYKFDNPRFHITPLDEALEKNK